MPDQFLTYLWQLAPGSVSSLLIDVKRLLIGISIAEGGGVLDSLVHFLDVPSQCARLGEAVPTCLALEGLDVGVSHVVVNQ